jgi:hypothetical protein
MMTKAEAACFVARLAGARRYLEFGCGGSTLLAVQSPAQTLHSVDSDGAWIEKCRRRPEIAAAAAAGRLHFRHVDLGRTGRFGYPIGRAAARRWPDYCLGVWENFPPDAPPDLVLVDGRFRLACATQALLRCPPGAKILFHDFTLRERYRGILDFAEAVETVDSLVVLEARAGLDTKALALFGFAHLFDTR